MTTPEKPERNRILNYPTLETPDRLLSLSYNQYAISVGFSGIGFLPDFFNFSFFIFNSSDFRVVRDLYLTEVTKKTTSEKSDK